LKNRDRRKARDEFPATCSAKVNSGGKQPLDSGSDAEQAMVVAISGDEHQSDWQPAFARQGELRAIGPTESSVYDKGNAPSVGTRHFEGLKATMPQNAAGGRTEPPVSLPIASTSA
jgi:hypothetical protein